MASSAVALKRTEEIAEPEVALRIVPRLPFRSDTPASFLQASVEGVMAAKRERAALETAGDLARNTAENAR